MKKTMIAILFSIIMITSTSTIACSTPIKKTKMSTSFSNKLTENEVSIGTITVDEQDVVCEGSLFSIKRVPKTFDLTVNYSLNAPRTGLPDIDVALAALVSLPDQENKKIDQTTDIRDGRLTLPLDMSSKLFCFKAYLLLGVYITIDFSDPFNPQFSFTPDFAIVSVLLLPWGDAVTQSHPLPDSYDTAWDVQWKDNQNIHMNLHGIPGTGKTGVTIPLPVTEELNNLKINNCLVK